MNAVSDSTKILQLDVAGRPVEWVDWKAAVKALFVGDVAWHYGDPIARVHGGRSRSGERSVFDLPPVIATRHAQKVNLFDHPVPLTNELLFARDGHVCMYCGQRLPARKLSRDHIIPRCQGGDDVWSNVACACLRCNQIKAGRRPEQAGMKLLAVPYAPNHAERLILSERRVLADQMQFLINHVPTARKGLFQ